MTEKIDDILKATAAMHSKGKAAGYKEGVVNLVEKFANRGVVFKQTKDRNI
ncbi:MAG TPA: hypothetical protein IAC63_00180 [Candidatus Enterousia avicola]|uniref:Uncharacterized protein n=1 Tax=Candidatus Enterousia avicola TaxID=2840787 RepID=A0A9D1SLW5_9PROT|nr:hypothetical protein [Candidatus Enterousia avicola]